MVGFASSARGAASPASAYRPVAYAAPAFLALPPESIPSPVSIARAIDPVLLDAIAEAAAGTETLPHWAAAACFAALHARVSATSVSVPACAAPVTTHDVLIADEAAHDRYFGIHRVTTGEAAQFLRSTLRAAWLFHAEMDTVYGRAQRSRFGAVGAGLASILTFATGRVAPPILRPDTPPPSSLVPDSGARWVLGHQLFAALTQGLILALTTFEQAMCEDDLVEAASALDLVADLMLASASAFRFTADFPPGDYADLIRPTMAPEHVGRGFSGLLSADHRYLVEVMTRTRPLMAKTAADLPRQHMRVTQALQHVYEDHKYVCARFGGAEASSLRTETCNEVPGVELLDRFKKSRLRLLRPAMARRLGKA